MMLSIGQFIDDKWLETFQKKILNKQLTNKFLKLAKTILISFAISSRSFHQLPNDTASDTDNNNGPKRVFYNNNKPSNVIPQDTVSSSASSKLNHSVSHSRIPRKKPPPRLPVNARKAPQKDKTPYTMVKSKSDLNTLKTYPDSFTVLPSPKRSPSAGYNNKRRKNNDDDDDDSLADFEWIKPLPEKLYEAATAADKYMDEPTYITDHFGQHVSVPSSPIITDKIMVGSSHR